MNMAPAARWLMRGRGPGGWRALLLVCWLIAAPALGQTPQTAPAGVGFVDMQRLLEQAPQMRQWRERLQAEFAERNRELAAEASSIEELRNKRAREALTMSAADLDALDKRIAAADRALKRARAELGSLEAVRKNEALDAINKGIGEAAAEAARERGFGAVLTREYAVYIDPALDLTEAVLRRLQRTNDNQKP